MRTIKFRAWNSKTGKMVDLQAITPLAMDPDLVKLGAKGLFIPFDEHMILMQFTGLLDSKNAEIYDGDIVRQSPESSSYVVEWGRLSNGDWETECYGWALYNAPNEVEVIGNVYENPELLEVGNVF